MHTYLRRISMPLAGEVKPHIGFPRVPGCRCGFSMPESPPLRFHICLAFDGEVLALCDETDPKYIVNAVYPFNSNPEFICAECLKSYQELGR